MLECENGPMNELGVGGRLLVCIEGNDAVLNNSNEYSKSISSRLLVMLSTDKMKDIYV